MWTPTITLTLALLVNITRATLQQPQPQPEDSTRYGVLCGYYQFSGDHIKKASYEGCAKLKATLKKGALGYFARRRSHPKPIKSEELLMDLPVAGPYFIWHIAPLTKPKLKNNFYVLFSYGPGGTRNCEPINVLMKQFELYVKCTPLSLPNPSVAPSLTQAQNRPGTNHRASSSSGSGSGSGSGSRLGHSKDRLQRNSPHRSRHSQHSQHSPPKTPYIYDNQASTSKHNSDSIDSSDAGPALENKSQNREKRIIPGAFGSFIEFPHPGLFSEKSP